MYICFKRWFSDSNSFKRFNSEASKPPCLDVSLNGVRFHCENPLSDGERASVGFRPDFGVSGKVCWCWPVEWYYQSAIQFTGITPEEQVRLREYIIAVTGEDYPDYSEDGAGIAVSAPEPVQPTPDLGLDDEDGWMDDLSEEELAAAEEDESDSFENKGFNEDSPDDPGSGSPR